MSSVSDETAVPIEQLPAQCQYMVPRKKRLCRMTVRPGKSYCGEHDRPEPTVDSATGIVEIDARIPCPLDPKHTCYASKLEKHLKVCNARCHSTPAYIIKGCNSAGEETEEGRVRLKDVPFVKLKTVVELIERLYSELVVNSIQCHSESDADSVHPSVSEDYELEERARSSLRHLRQTSSLLHTLQREGLVMENTCYIELGAGKGHVSYYLSRAVRDVPACSVLLVDRASHRHKQDNKLDPSRHRVSRIRADINDLRLSQVEDVKAARSVVAVSKHLCGVATDYALRCVTAASVLDKTRGLVMATCCHHRCTASSYVAWDFLKDKGITREYFDIMMGVVSWATCGTGYSRERRNWESQNADSKRQKLTTDHAADQKSDREREKNSPDEQNIVRNGNTEKETYANLSNNVGSSNFSAASLSNMIENSNLTDMNLGNSVDQSDLTSANLSNSDDKSHLTSAILSNSVNKSDLTSANLSNSVNKSELTSDNLSNSVNKSDLTSAHLSNSVNKSDMTSANLSNSVDNSDLTSANLNNSVDKSDLTDDNLSNIIEYTDLTDVKGLGLTVERRTEIGRRAKALLDYGRTVFLKERGFDAKLCYYVDVDVSPENVCIVAKKLCL